MEKGKPALVIMAAGMGSRYGALKQMDSYSPEGDTIIDFSLYDALEAGFEKFVFIIRKSFEVEFKAVFNKKLDNKAEVIYVFQELENIPKKYINPKRTKPWGTGHALLMVKDVVNENFAIINGDDFYGKEAFHVMFKSLVKQDKNLYKFYSMAYLLKNTVSDYGYVSRGKCEIDGNGYLLDITEFTHIEKMNDNLMRKDDEGKFIPIDGSTVVSMNFWGFTPKFFEFADEIFEEFLEVSSENLNDEFYLPSIIKGILKLGKVSVKVLKSNAKWFGVTYKEDKTIVQKAISDLKEQSVYPIKLW